MGRGHQREVGADLACGGRTGCHILGKLSETLRGREGAGDLPTPEQRERGSGVSVDEVVLALSGAWGAGIGLTLPLAAKGNDQKARHLEGSIETVRVNWMPSRGGRARPLWWLPTRFGDG